MISPMTAQRHLYDLTSIFRRTSMPLLLTMVTGCASTIQKFDPDSCMEWSESTARAAVLTIESRTASSYENACTEGRAGAQVTLIGNNGKNLHPASASVGKEFSRIVAQKAQEERSKLPPPAVYGNDNDAQTPPAPRETYFEKVGRYFNIYLERAGFTMKDIDRAIDDFVKQQEAARKPNIPEGCSRNPATNALICK